MDRRLFTWWTCALVCLGASVASAGTISGTIFEDVNYGGGAGRSMAASGGVGVAAGVRVELFTGNTLTLTTTTAAGGTYSFTRNAGTYTIRVASRTLATTRAGGC